MGALFLPFIVPSYLVAHADAINVARYLEHGGRLKGRGTVVIFAGPLCLTALLVALSAAQTLGLEPIDTAQATWLDAAATGALLLVSAAGLGRAALAVTRRLPPRARRGPVRRRNARLARLVDGLSRLPELLFSCILAAAMYRGLTVNPPRSLMDVLEWLLVSALALWIFLLWWAPALSAILAACADQLAGHPRESDQPQPTTLYLRPFDQERQLFADGRSFEEFFAPTVERQIGTLVALGDPTDRVAPAGARRTYAGDDDWQQALDVMARAATCVIALTRSSPNTDWELMRLRQLDLHHRLVLLSPPAPADAAPPDRPGVLERVPPFVGRAVRVINAYLDDDTTRLTQLLGGDHLPRALSPSTPTPWDEFALTLQSCGFTVSIGDPGAGAVIGFDGTGAAVLVGQGATSAEDYARHVAGHLGATGRPSARDGD